MFNDVLLATFKDRKGRVLEIRCGNRPDETVLAFLDNLDEEAKRLFRHVPDCNNEVQYFAFDENGKMVAYSALYPLDNPDEFVHATCIAKEWRGAGLGTYLVSLADVVAKQHDRKRISGEVDAGNVSSVKMMRKNGYTLYGPIYTFKKVLE